MPVLAPERAEEVVAAWRRSAEPFDGLDNPAGALYASGKFAEADIITACYEGSGKCGTICSGSATNDCC